MQDSDSLYIDLGRYIEVLFRQWQLILGAMLICVLAAVWITTQQPESYQARALVASTKTLTAASFGSLIETLPEEQISGAFNLAARLGSYVQLVQNPAIAEDVLAEMGDRLTPGEQDVGALLRMVSGELAEQSDAIEITVTHRDPVMARDIANAWAGAYVDHVNAIYAGGGSEESLSSIRAQAAEAKAEYDRAQADLEVFLSDNRAGQYERQIVENKSMILGFSNAITMTANTVISNTVAAQLAVFNHQVGSLSTQLEETYGKARQVDGLLLDARNMRDQVLEGGTGAVNSNALALMLLKSQVFATREGAPNLIVQTTPSNTTSEEMVPDLDSLIAILEVRQSELQDQIQVLSNQLLNLNGTGSEVSLAEGNAQNSDRALAALEAMTGLSGLEGVAELNLAETPLEQKKQALEETINQLEAGLAGELGREQELTRARDLAWETYNSLATKEAELKVVAQTAGSEVAFAAPAAVPQNASASGVRNVALAAVVGLMLGVAAAYFIEFWWGYRGFQPEPITVVSVFRGVKLKPVPRQTTSD